MPPSGALAGQPIKKHIIIGIQELKLTCKEESFHNDGSLLEIQVAIECNERPQIQIIE